MKDGVCSNGGSCFKSFGRRRDGSDFQWRIPLKGGGDFFEEKWPPQNRPKQISGVGIIVICLENCGYRFGESLKLWCFSDGMFNEPSSSQVAND